MNIDFIWDFSYKINVIRLNSKILMSFSCVNFGVLQKCMKLQVWKIKSKSGYQKPVKENSNFD